MVRCLPGVVVLCWWMSPAWSQDAWPDFRGPRGDGHAVQAKVPLRWSETQHVRWKTPIAGRGWSSPVVRDAQVWMTTATEEGRRLWAVCVDGDSGRVVHQVLVFEVEQPVNVNPLNSHASPSPVIEPGRVYVHFGTNGTACLDTASGAVLWQRTDLKLDHKEGPGSSPILHGRLLIVHCDGMDVQYVIALDKQTGQTVWQTQRSLDLEQFDPDFRKAYSTPLVIHDGTRAVLLSTGGKAGYAYEAETGRELWRIRYSGFSNVARPLVWNDLAIINTGYPKAELWGVRLGGRGDVTDSHVAWRYQRAVCRNPSPLVVGDLLFMVDDRGVATCLQCADGAEVWTQRIGGNYAASPIYAAGRIYFFSQEGTTTVIAPQRQYQALAVNTLDDGCMASPAVAGNALFVRTKTHLYRIEE